jgi:hypothetical protein
MALIGSNNILPLEAVVNAWRPFAI